MENENTVFPLQNYAIYIVSIKDLSYRNYVCKNKIIIAEFI